MQAGDRGGRKNDIISASTTFRPNQSRAAGPKRRPCASWRIRSDMFYQGSPLRRMDKMIPRQTTFTTHPHAPTTRGCLGEARHPLDAKIRFPAPSETGGIGSRRVISTPPRFSGGLAVQSCDAVFNRRAGRARTHLSLIPLLGAAGVAVPSPAPMRSLP